MRYIDMEVCKVLSNHSRYRFCKQKASNDMAAQYIRCKSSKKETVMIMNTEHPKFDIAMELLCSLPLAPVYVSMKDLAADLGLTKQREVRDLIDQLEQKGIGVITTTDPRRGRVACISESDWKRAQVLGREYWEAVNGESLLPVAFE